MTETEQSDGSLLGARSLHRPLVSPIRYAATLLRLEGCVRERQGIISLSDSPAPRIERRRLGIPCVLSTIRRWRAEREVAEGADYSHALVVPGDGEYRVRVPFRP